MHINYQVLKHFFKIKKDNNSLNTTANWKQKLLVICLLIIFLVLLAIYTDWWLRPLLEFISLNTDLIQGITDFIQILIWIIAGIIPLVKLFRPLKDRNINSLRLAISSVEDKLRTYFNCVEEECKTLPLGIISAEFTEQNKDYSVSLVEIYIDLEVYQIGEGGSINKEKDWFQLYNQAQKEKRVPAMDIFSNQKNNLAVLLGETGSGKTTFINYITYLLIDKSRYLPSSLKGLIPIKFQLRDVASTIPSSTRKGSAKILLDALTQNISQYFDVGVSADIAKIIHEKAILFGSLILFDGLDEVTESKQRIILDSIKYFIEATYNERMQVIITTRPYAYEKSKNSLLNYSTWTLTPLTPSQTEEFIFDWYKKTTKVYGWSSKNAELRSKSIIHAIKSNKYLKVLGSRPLLLMLMTAIHTRNGKLPEDRADLYEEAVKLLLSRWQRSRILFDKDGKEQLEPGISEALQIDEKKIRTALERLAFSVHDKQSHNPQNLELLPDIQKSEILESFEGLLGDIEPKIILRYLDNRAGLLVERQPDTIYAFPHRSFQEYLAACYLTEDPNFHDKIINRVTKNLSFWREVYLLCIRKIRRGSLPNAVNVIQYLVPNDFESINKVNNSHWKKAILAAEAIVDLHLTDKIYEDNEYYISIIKRVKKWLKMLIVSEDLSANERLVAGDLLGFLGDNRKGASFLQLNNNPIPDIDWIHIPKGGFKMGASSKDKKASNFERPSHDFYLPDYYIGRYPITYAQYALFIDDKGYEREELWCKKGWDWVNGGEVDLKIFNNSFMESKYEAWLERRPKIKKNPLFWDDPFWAKPSRPVIGINWYEAAAFGKWMTLIYQRNIEYFDFLTNKEFTVRLPSDAEWEKAAKGVKQNKWPWGNNVTTKFANTKEQNLGRTTPVGIYPNGSSKYGVMDMIGNVWEWTNTIWGEDTSSPTFNYPYDSNDGREYDSDFSDFTIRTVRGSSWISDLERYGRTTAREWGFTYNCSTFSGFRLVIAIKDL